MKLLVTKQALTWRCQSQLTTMHDRDATPIHS
jgi:hypothetical protein